MRKLIMAFCVALGLPVFPLSAFGDVDTNASRKQSPPLISVKLATAMNLSIAQRDEFLALHGAYVPMDVENWRRTCETRKKLTTELSGGPLTDSDAAAIVEGFQALKKERYELDVKLLERLRKLLPAGKVAIFMEFQLSDFETRVCPV